MIRKLEPATANQYPMITDYRRIFRKTESERLNLRQRKMLNLQMRREEFGTLRAKKFINPTKVLLEK